MATANDPGFLVGLMRTLYGWVSAPLLFVYQMFLSFFGWNRNATGGAITEKQRNERTENKRSLLLLIATTAL